MGLGHVPQEPIRAESANPDVQGRQRRGTTARGIGRSGLERGSDRRRIAERAALAGEGEELAAQWYLDNGYSILARNWRCRAGEIDLVVARADVVVISEVKTRSTDYFGPPAGAVDADKQRRLRRLAVLWLATQATSRRRIRFDVVEVLKTRASVGINVIESAF